MCCSGNCSKLLVLIDETVRKTKKTSVSMATYSNRTSCLEHQSVLIEVATIEWWKIPTAPRSTERFHCSSNAIRTWTLEHQDPKSFRIVSWTPWVSSHSMLPLVSSSLDKLLDWIDPVYLMCSQPEPIYHLSERVDLQDDIISFLPMETRGIESGRCTFYPRSCWVASDNRSLTFAWFAKDECRRISSRSLRENHFRTRRGLEASIE